MDNTAGIIFPHQLFADHPLLEVTKEIFLIEEFLYFRQYRFHKQKIAFHRAGMKHFQHLLENRGITVHYIESVKAEADIRNFGDVITRFGIKALHVVDLVDDWLNNRLIKAVGHQCRLVFVDSPMFLNTSQGLQPFFRKDKKSFFQTTFYKQQRESRNILMEALKNPLGGKWTFDTENRRKFPKGKRPPTIYFPKADSYWKEAVAYVQSNFESNPGVVSGSKIYPTTPIEAQEWLDQFLEFRFHEFGHYEDAIVAKAHFLNHSLLSPLLNAGLITPQAVLEKSLAYAQRAKVPINSAEGFVRQIIGWREFVRGMYEVRGSYSRTRNFWNFKRKIPYSFYNGSTGIEPIDQTIRKVLDTGYCHHIERLMVLGNFMLLCEFDPDEVYRWFMELFIDAYDWVMVPNVYGMALFADGGLFATKPYISSSNYIKKMSDYESGPWEEIWDSLFWRFIHQHKDFFSSNPRTSMMVRTWNKMKEENQEEHLRTAAAYLSGMS